MDPRAQDTIQARQADQKKALIDELQKMPVIEVACRRTDTSRSTYYRWVREDLAFAQEANEALRRGKSIINDLAESKVIAGIKNDDRVLTMFWLNNNHETYGTRAKLSQYMKQGIAGASAQLSDDEISQLFEFLQNPDTLKKGQELLASYVLRGVIDESHAQFILRLLMMQMKVEDSATRKTGTEIMSEVLFREKVNNIKRNI